MFLKYVDFAKRDGKSKFPTFNIQDFDWDQAGFSILSQFNEDIAQKLDDKFRSIMLSNEKDSSDVDFVPFQRAVWNYVQSLWGIMHDDYDYLEIDKIVPRLVYHYL